MCFSLEYLLHFVCLFCGVLYINVRVCVCLNYYSRFLLVTEHAGRVWGRDYVKGRDQGRVLIVTRTSPPSAKQKKNCAFRPRALTSILKMAEFKFDFAVNGRSGDALATETDAIRRISLPEITRKSQPTESVGSHSKVSVTPVSRPDAAEISLQAFHHRLAKSLHPSEYRTPGNGTTLCYVSLGSLQECVSAHGKSSESVPADAIASSQVAVGGKENLIPSALQTELESLLRFSNSQHSDLIPGVYEGGMKVWECAFDLVSYLTESGVQFSGMGVLELGCGAGLPGLCALLNGAERVHFQDYNPEVINCITMPTVLLNTEHSQSGSATGLVSKCRFFSGDWNEFAALASTSSRCEQAPYDIILTSETIYSTSSQPKLLTALKLLLRPETGIAFVAAKSHYFGVGGSVQQFLELVETDGYFEVFTCWTIDSSVPRKILRLSPRQDG